MAEARTEDAIDVFHTGPGTLAGRYLRSFWQPVYRGADLAPGQAKPLKLLSEQFTLYRGASGSPHLLAFRCAHRGTQLSTGWVEGDDLRCFYHGWKYAPSGQCIEQPAEPEPFAQKVRVGSYPTEEYLGLIFAYLGEGEPPPLPRYPDFEEDGLLETATYTRACNYYQDLENDNDDFHGVFVHGKARGIANWRDSMPQVEVWETEWGLAAQSTYPNGIVQVDQEGMPNMLNNVVNPLDAESGERYCLHWVLPIDDENHVRLRTDMFKVTGDARERFLERRGAWFARGGRLYAPELSRAILDGRMGLQDIDWTFQERSRIEDDLAQVGQGPIHRREGEHLGREDAGVILFRSLWERELRALAQRRPLKQWRRPPTLQPTKGYWRDRRTSGVVV